MNKGMEAESNFQVVGGHGRQGSRESGGGQWRETQAGQAVAKGDEAEETGWDTRWPVSQFCTSSLDYPPERWVRVAHRSLVLITCMSRHNRSDLSETKDLSLKPGLCSSLLFSLLVPSVGWWLADVSQTEPVHPLRVLPLPLLRPPLVPGSLGSPLSYGLSQP